jgi:hypothetical protein
MKKVTCCPESLLPDTLDPDVLYINMFSSAAQKNIWHVGTDLPTAIRRDGLSPSVQAWDFATIAAAVVATDHAIPRKQSSDGWTRMIELSIYLNEPAVWDTKHAELEYLLRFLTGDFWTLRFLPGGIKAPKAKKPANPNADCVCLLSGGMDSLVGAIDLTSVGKKPLFVSQVVRGSRLAQSKFAAALGGADRHYQWSFAVGNHGTSEKSTRARSIMFFAFAAIAASAISMSEKQPVEIIVPENGFISLNIPLGAGRLGSLSTKTTHPVYTAGIQAIWDAVGIPARLSFPYQDRTKGEILLNCANQSLLIELIGDSISCAKHQRNKLTQCGECVPCMVRRAAFLKANLQDTTVKGYLCENLAHSESRDVAAVAAAYLRYQDIGIRRFTGGTLFLASQDDCRRYEDVVARGMDELGQLLSKQKVI